MGFLIAAPAESPPGEFFANDPGEGAGWVTLVDEDWTNGVEGGDWTHEDGDPGNVTTIADGTLPYGTHALQITYPSGMSAGASPCVLATSQAELEEADNRQELYVGFFVKYESGWQWNGVEKLFFPWVFNGGQNTAPFEFAGTPPNISACGTYWSGEISEWNQGVTPAEVVDDGTWMHIEYYWKLETGTDNGIERIWFDGELVLERTDVSTNQGYIALFRFDPTWGGTGGTKSQDDLQWLGPIKIRVK